MVIHIEFDIKITDHDGIVLQSIGNHCDENVSSDGKQNTDTILGMDFTDFLAEYLSSSGFFLREKLMKSCSSRRLKRHEHSQIIKENTKSEELNDENMLDRLKGSELEYKIRIGNNKVLIGKIPLVIDAEENPGSEQNIISASLVAKEPGDYEELVNSCGAGSYEETFNSNQPYDGETETSVSSDNDVETDQYESYVSDEESKNSESPDHDSGSAVYSFLNYSMMRAIEKYEDNIYNVWYEDSTDMEPAIDE